MQQAFGASASWRDDHQSEVHSQTLPIMSWRPYPFGGKAVTGEVRSNPSSQRFSTGKIPCQVFATCLPPGVKTLPHA